MSLAPIASRMPSSVDDRCRVEREIEGRELGKAARPLAIDPRQLARVRIETGIRPIRTAFRVDARLHQRQHRGVALGGEVEARERGGDDFRRRGLEIEEQAQRFRQIDVGEIAQHVAVDASVEEPGQDGLAQQVCRCSGCRSSTARASLPNITRETRGSSAREERRDVAELPAQAPLRR